MPPFLQGCLEEPREFIDALIFGWLGSGGRDATKVLYLARMSDVDRFFFSFLFFFSFAINNEKGKKEKANTPRYVIEKMEGSGTPT